MAATITGCKVYTNVDGSIDRYEVSFTSDVIPAKLVIPVVNVRAGDVDDLTNLDQVKTAALLKIQRMETFVQRNQVQSSSDVSLD